MKFYIAARFSRRPEAHELAKKLISLGHTITSRWVKPESDHVPQTGLSEQALDSERTRFAIEDCADVAECDCCISLMEEPRNNSRGGRHVEFGYALGLGKTILIIGPRETVFHHLPRVTHFNTTTEFLESLAAATAHLSEEQASAQTCKSINPPKFPSIPEMLESFVRTQLERQVEES